MIWQVLWSIETDGERIRELCALPLITKTIKFRWSKHAEHCWSSKEELISNILMWIPSHGRAKVGPPAKPIYNCSVPIQDITLKTTRVRWTIETGGKRGSGRSVLAVIYIYIYIERERERDGRARIKPKYSNNELLMFVISCRALSRRKKLQLNLIYGVRYKSHGQMRGISHMARCFQRTLTKITPYSLIYW